MIYWLPKIFDDIFKKSVRCRTKHYSRLDLDGDAIGGGRGNQEPEASRDARGDVTALLGRFKKGKWRQERDRGDEKTCMWSWSQTGEMMWSDQKAQTLWLGLDPEHLTPRLCEYFCTWFHFREKKNPQCNCRNTKHGMLSFLFYSHAYFKITTEVRRQTGNVPLPAGLWLFPQLEHIDLKVNL